MSIWLMALALCGILTSLWAYWHKPTWVSVALWPAVFIGIYGTGLETIGRPKPVNLEWRQLDKTQVLAWHGRENEVIWLWLYREEQPVSYVMPWTAERAKELHAAQEKAEQQGGRVIARIFGENSMEDRQAMFYHEPQPPLPPK